MIRYTEIKNRKNHTLRSQPSSGRTQPSRIRRQLIRL